jgi:hypothetical protein
VFHITNAGLCGKCETDVAVLPSLESFQLGMALPKVMFIFYVYFFKAMVGGAAWKKRFEEDVRLEQTSWRCTLKPLSRTTTLRGCMNT